MTRCPKCGQDGGSMILGPGDELPHNCEATLEAIEVARRTKASDKKWAELDKENEEAQPR